MLRCWIPTPRSHSSTSAPPELVSDLRGLSSYRTPSDSHGSTTMQYLHKLVRNPMPRLLSSSSARHTYSIRVFCYLPYRRLCFQHRHDHVIAGRLIPGRYGGAHQRPRANTSFSCFVSSRPNGSRILCDPRNHLSTAPHPCNPMRKLPFSHATCP